VGSRRAALAAALTVLALAPGQATAATIATDRPCYTVGESILLNGSGFPRSSWVSLRLDGIHLGGLTTDGDGSFDTRMPGPPVIRSSRLRVVARTAHSDREPTVGHVRVTPVDVRVAPAIGSPLLRRHIVATGFMGPGALYAHVRRRSAGRARNIRLGRPHGPCGTLRVSRRLFEPSVRHGLYDVQFDALRSYLPGLEPSVGYLIGVFRDA
jgi:hypothetical protein